MEELKRNNGWKVTLRKLAREAVIFMLIAFALGIIGGCLSYYYAGAGAVTCNFAVGKCNRNWFAIIDTGLTSGILGFGAGFALWVFYRLVVFAIKG